MKLTNDKILGAEIFDLEDWDKVIKQYEGNGWKFVKSYRAYNDPIAPYIICVYKKWVKWFSFLGITIRHKRYIEITSAGSVRFY